MKNIEFIPIKNVIVADRARKHFSPEGLATLKADITSNAIGLLHPILIRNTGELITGERRFRVISELHMEGANIRFAGKPVPPDMIPVIRVESDFDLLDYLIAESVENSSRENFTWQEKAALDSRIVMLQQMKLDNKSSAMEVSDNLLGELDSVDMEEGDDEDTPARPRGKVERISANLHLVSKEAIKSAAEQVYGVDHNSSSANKLATSVKLTRALEDPLMSSKLKAAPTRKEAEKILKVEERRQMQASIAHAQGKELRSADRHLVIHGDCLTELAKLQSASVDLCVTDPIYGINAHKFGVAKRDTGFHTYEDTPEEFERIMPLAIAEVSRILKPAAHMYLFCDLTKFYQLKAWIEAAGTKDNPWTVQSFPLHWIKVNGSRSPHPGYTYRKTVEYIVFAYRGGRMSNHQHDSHWEVTTQRTEIHGAAKSPDSLRILLNNSAYPGDLVLDFMAGSGSTAVAAHECKMRSILIENEPSAYGRCVERVTALTSGK